MVDKLGKISCLVFYILSELIKSLIFWFKSLLISASELSLYGPPVSKNNTDGGCTPTGEVQCQGRDTNRGGTPMGETPTEKGRQQGRHTDGGGTPTGK